MKQCKIPSFIALFLTLITLIVTYANYTPPAPHAFAQSLTDTVEVQAQVIPPAPTITSPLPIDNFFSPTQLLSITGNGYPLSTLYIQENGQTLCSVQVGSGTIPSGGSFSCTALYTTGIHDFEVFVRIDGIESAHTLMHGVIVTAIPPSPTASPTATSIPSLVPSPIPSSIPQSPSVTMTPDLTNSPTATSSIIITSTWTPSSTATSVGTIIASPTVEITPPPTNTPPFPSDDQDNDGIPDQYERDHRLDPNDPNDRDEDPDNDGLTNLQEYQNSTDPHSADSDGDGLKDGEEVLTYRTNPLNPDTDGEGLNDFQEVKIYRTNPLSKDTDQGGVDDKTEVDKGTDPLDPNTASVRGLVFEDTNKNKILDADEKLLPGIVVELHSIIQKTVSLADGKFTFLRVSPGNHILSIEQTILDRLKASVESITLENVREDMILEVAFPLSPSLLIDIIPKTGEDFSRLILYLAFFLFFILLLFRKKHRKQKIKHIEVKKEVDANTKM